MNPVEEFLHMKKVAAGWLSNLGRGLASGFTGGEMAQGASTLGRMLGQVGQGVAVSGLVAGAGLAASRGVGAIRDRFSKARNFQSMIEATPSLQKEDAGHVQMIYNSLHRLSPTMAKDPVLAGSFVRESLRMGPEGQPSIRFDTAKMLSETERNLTQSGKGHPVLQSMLSNLRPMGMPQGPAQLAGKLTAGIDPRTGMYNERVERNIYGQDQLTAAEQRLREEAARNPRIRFGDGGREP